MKLFRNIVVILCVVLAVPGSLVFAKDMGGWEEDGAYNKLFKAAELDRLKCRVVKLKEVTPIKGMSPGLALVVDDGDGEEVEVHIGPKWFFGDSIGIRKGEKLKIRGAWAEIDGKEIFMAAKIKKSSSDFFTLKVRLTKTGKPFWTMGKEELEREREATK